MSQSELIERLADLALKKFDPEVKEQLKKQSKIKSRSSSPQYGLSVPAAPVDKKVATNQTQTHTATASAALRKETVKQPARTQKLSRYIPSTIKQEVYMRDKGCYTFKDHRTNKQCTSKHLLQYDHVRPMAFNGETAVENLRLLCFNHHKLVTQKVFGEKPTCF